MKALAIISFFWIIGAVAAPNDQLQTFFKDKTKIENPLELRDPFKPNLPRVEDKAEQKQNYFFKQGRYSNIDNEKDVEDLSIDKMKVVGVMIGKERRALIKNPTSKGIVVLKEGMKVGPEEAELKAILPGGIVLVEKIINVYGQEEYLETVIPISK
ncbi:MAG: pilus assembly protein PilP [Bacteriovoracaceae bacterium]